MDAIQNKENKGIIDRFGLKIIMAVLMLADHIWYFFPESPLIFHQLARVVAPVFVYLMTQGMVYTKSRRDYIFRLFWYGGAMFVGNAILVAIFRTPLNFGILLSLGFSALLIAAIDLAISSHGLQQPLCVAFAIMLITASILFEGGLLIPMMATTFYYLKDRKLVMCAVYIASIFAYRMVFGMSDTQLLMIFATIPILLYNGKRGLSSKFASYFFYIFYPVHIWILYILSHIR